MTLTGSATAPPVPLSVTPSTGSGFSQTFSFVYTNEAGAANIWYTVATINSSLNFSNSCTVDYVPGTQQIYLMNDTGTAWLSPITLGSGTLENSQCTVNSAASTATLVGNTLTLNLALAFQSAFQGSKNIYMDAKNSVGRSGWTQNGIWVIP